MAVHAGNARMRREGISGVLRAHHRVAQLSAKRDRLGELVRFVAARETHHHEDDQEGHEGNDRAALVAIVQVDAGIKRRANQLLCGARSGLQPGSATVQGSENAGETM